MVPGSGDAVCALREVRHRYGDHVALQGVTLDVDKGEVVSLLGPNGSGKTTLFRLLSSEYAR